jgi:hypothetical protein
MDGREEKLTNEETIDNEEKYFTWFQERTAVPEHGIREKFIH